jgi:hypothetical protein
MVQPLLRVLNIFMIIHDFRFLRAVLQKTSMSVFECKVVDELSMKLYCIFFFLLIHTLDEPLNLIDFELKNTHFLLFYVLLLLLRVLVTLLRLRSAHY